MFQKLKNTNAETWFCFVCVIIHLILVFTLILPVIAFSRISGSSMNPTLEDGNFYLVTAYSHIQPGDIVIADSAQLNTTIVKRVIGVPGDTIAITDGTVYRNNTPLTEDYIAEPMVTKDVAAFVLEDDMYYLMGDNRNCSADSRMIGPVCSEDIRYVVSLQPQMVSFIEYLAIVIVLAILVVMLATLEAKYLAKLWRKRRRTATANS